MADITRRQVLQGSTAAAVGALLLPAALPGTRRAATTSRPVLGADHHAWAQVAGGIGAMRGMRCYAPASKGVPSRWFRTAPGVSKVVASINPNISDVLAGRLNHQLAAFARLVPRGSSVTCWHEGEEHNHGAHVSAAELVAMHKHCHAIFASEGARYVQVVGGYSPIALGARFPAYISPVVDGVFSDGYQYHPGEAAQDVFGPVAAAIAKAGNRLVGIAESNSKFPAGRAAWFASGWQYAMAHHLETYFVWFSNRLPQFAWHSGDRAVVSELKRIRGASLA